MFLYVNNMTVLQIPLSDEMKNKLNQITKPVGISNTAYIKILIARELGLLPDQNKKAFTQGNLFNADRDNNGQGIPFSDVRKMLQS